MNLLYEQDYNLRTSDFDKYNHIHPASVLDLFQGVAGAHAVEMGIGYDAMIESKMLWVLVKVKFQILKNPKLYQHVTVRTWPLPPAKLSFRREYLILDDDGETLVKGTSEWVVMHSEKRRLVSALDAYPVKEGFITEELFEERLIKIPPFEGADKHYQVLTGFCDCDINGHVNNTKYANYVMNALNPEENMVVDTFRLEFNREVQPDTLLNISLKHQDGEILAKGESESENVAEDGTVTKNKVKNFSCQITFK